MNFEELVKAAEEGDMNAGTTLGIIAQDFEMALKYILPAAESGNEEAMFYLGGMFLNGMGVEADVAKAIEYFTIAAKAGYDSAQLLLGLAYLEGEGVEKNLETAEMWLTAAAEQGNEDAAFELENLKSLK